MTALLVSLPILELYSQKRDKWRAKLQTTKSIKPRAEGVHPDAQFTRRQAPGNIIPLVYDTRINSQSGDNTYIDVTNKFS
jgi:hypothetical protein